MIRRSLTAKLLAAQLLVILAGSTTLALVALSLGPGLFHRHVRDALGVIPADVGRHLDEAFARATLVSLAIAVAAAALTAAAVGIFVSRRVARPVAALAADARRIAAGHYGERVPVAGTDEVARLGTAFNAMAASLESAEERRRRLLNDIAHELRTPLATIEGYVEGLADGVVPSGEDTWRVLGGEARRLGRLVDDLQRVSRAEEHQLDLRVERVSTSRLLDPAHAAAAPAYAQKQVSLRVEHDDAMANVDVDRDRLGEVLANLLENALRHTPAGGEVVLAASHRGDTVELSVADTGEGIAAEHLPHLFERFYRADPARSRAAGGSGIGLAIARAIVEAHGGTIRAESEGPGRGSRFAVELPSAR